MIDRTRVASIATVELILAHPLVVQDHAVGLSGGCLQKAADTGLARNGLIVGLTGHSRVCGLVQLVSLPAVHSAGIKNDLRTSKTKFLCNISDLLIARQVWSALRHSQCAVYEDISPRCWDIGPLGQSRSARALNTRIISVTSPLATALLF